MSKLISIRILRHSLLFSVLFIQSFLVFADDPRQTLFHGQFLYSRKMLFQTGAMQWQSPMQIPGQFHALGFGYVSSLSSSTNELHQYVVYYAFSLFLPGNALLPDSSQGKYRGYTIDLLMFGFDVLSQYRKADLNFHFGIETGRMRMKGEGFDLRNPLFAPKAMLGYKRRLGRLILGIHGSASLDISSSKWKSLHFGRKDSRDIPGTQQSGAALTISIGFN
jgi:hypothetical protein